MANDDTKWGWSQLILFALWQGAYAASLAPLLRSVTGSEQRTGTTRNGSTVPRIGVRMGLTLRALTGGRWSCGMRG